MFVSDGEFRPEADDSDDEETIEKEEAAGIDEVSVTNVKIISGFPKTF